ncbi:hypothetical protein BST95_12050 [Halioglobus japonicus]|nr:serine hydrolase [Halioglobus japonicus]AQA18858.1 hypothetical protein BST95_12050 [Halioglobus japonicus]GHD23480.1 6-aminohexanoate-dimer hydrolase [Halioglobus japonicus]
MKKILVIALVLIALPLIALHRLDISPLGLGEAMTMGTGMTAKLGCSGIHLSGFSDDEILDDLASYSPAAKAISLRRIDATTVEADINGMSVTRARYIPGLGCALELPGMIDRDALAVPVIAATEGPKQAVDTQLQSIVDAVMAEDNVAGLDTRALYVLRDGELVAEAYRDGISAATPLLGWSMAKSVTAMMLARMEALGLAATSSANLFPEWRDDERRDITLLNLLQMSSGLAFEEVYGPGSDATRMLFTVVDASAVPLAQPQEHPPASHFAYSSGTTNLLARYAQLQLGAAPQAAIDFWSTQLAGPLGLAGTTFEMDPSGIFVGSSYLYAPARDWARLGQLMLDDGRLGDQQLLPAGWVARATAPNSSSNDPRYGYQFWLNRGTKEPRWPALEPGAYAMMGNRGQVVMMLPEHNAVVVRLGWSATEYPYSQQLGRIQAAL